MWAATPTAWYKKEPPVALRYRLGSRGVMVWYGMVWYGGVAVPKLGSTMVGLGKVCF